MKLTIVIDTDDIEGIADAFKIAGHFYRKYVVPRDWSHQLSYGKIKHIKMLRAFARKAIEAHEAGKDPVSLRFTKDYTDALFLADSDNPAL